MMINKSLTLLFLLIFAIPSLGQMDKVSEIIQSRYWYRPYEVIHCENYSLLRGKYENSRITYYTLNHTSLKLDSFELYRNGQLEQAKINPVSFGSNYSTYNTRIFGISESGSRINLFEFDDPQSYSKPFVKYYHKENQFVSGWKNGQSCVVETDGSKDGTRMIFSTKDTIVGIVHHLDSMVYVTKNLNQFHVFKASDTVSAFLGSFPSDGINLKYRVLTQDSLGVYLNYEDLTGTEKVGYLNLGNGCEFTKFLDREEVNKLIFREDYIVVSQFPYYQEDDQFWTRINRNDFSKVDTLAMGAYYSDYPHRILRDVGDSLFLTFSNYHGYEWAKINEEGKFELEDFATGINSSIPIALKGPEKSGSRFSDNFFWMQSNWLQHENHFILSNGNDNHFYWYTRNKGEFECRFRVPNPENIFSKVATKTGNLIFVKTDSSMIIYNHDINAPSLKQPKQKIENQVISQIVNLDIRFPYTYAGQMNIEKIVEDEEGNLFVGYYSYIFNRTDGLKSNYQRLTGDTASNELNAAFNILKFDSLGNLLWTQNFGMIRGYSGASGGFSFDVNRNKLVVVGNTGAESYFNGNYSEDVYNQVFLMQLDGTTGKQDWLEFISLNNGPQNVKDLKLGLTANNEIIMAFEFSSSLNIKGHVMGDRNSYFSTYASILKLDAARNVQWKKVLVTEENDYNPILTSLNVSKKYSKFSLICRKSTRTNSANVCDDYHKDVLIFMGDNEGWVTTKKINGTSNQNIVNTYFTDESTLKLMGWFEGSISMGELEIGQLEEAGCRSKQLYYLDWKSNSSVPIDFHYLNTSLKDVMGGEVNNDLGFVIVENKNEEVLALQFDLYSESFKARNLVNPNRENSLYYSKFLRNGDILTSVTNAGPDSTIGYQSLMNNFSYNTIFAFSPSQLSSQNLSFVAPPNESINRENYIWLYPNPAQDQINISVFDANTYHEYQIFDLKGQLISVGNFTQDLGLTIDVSSLRNGMYLLRLTGHQKVLSYRFNVFKNKE